MRTPNSFHIMVTDTNHHIRDLLKRELEQERYTVHSINTAATVRQFIQGQEPLDLIILDPELFYPYDYPFVAEIRQYRGYAIDIIIHAYKDTLREMRGGPHIHLVEKNAQSIHSLKNTIQLCLLSFG